MVIWNVKCRCRECDHSYKGHVATSDGEFPAIVCPGCGKSIRKGLAKSKLGQLTRNCAAIYTRLLGERLADYATPFSVQVLYPDLPHKAGMPGPTLDLPLGRRKFEAVQK